MADDPSARAVAQEVDDVLAEAAFRTGDFTAASSLLEQALDASRSSGDLRTEAFALDRLGMVQHYRNIMHLIAGEPVAEADVAAEEELFDRALGLRESLGDPAGTAQSLFGAGLVHQVLRGDWDAAMGCFTRALMLADDAGTSLDLYTRSEIHRHVGFYFLVEEVDLRRATSHLQTSLDLRERLGDERRIPGALVALGRAEAAAGNRRRAVELLELAVDRARTAGLSAPWLRDAEQALADAQGGAGDDERTGSP